MVRSSVDYCDKLPKDITFEFFFYSNIDTNAPKLKEIITNEKNKKNPNKLYKKPKKLL